MSNTSGVAPQGPRILVRPYEPSETFEGSKTIIMPEKLKREEELAATEGVVVAMGSEAFVGEQFRSRWCEVGDTIVFARYAGQLRQGKDGSSYRLINDVDVIARVES